MKRAFADIPEGQVHYRTEGSGEPLVLLHMTPASSEQYLEVIPVLARNCRVLAMDTLGYGYSDVPPSEYEIGDFARSVASFLGTLKIKKASVVGHYTGAAIAAEVAAAYPDRVDKLILSGCPYWPQENWEAFMNNSDSPGLKKRITSDGKFLMDLWQSSLETSPWLTPEARLKSLMNTLTTSMMPYDAHYAVMRYDFKSRLPLIENSTLLMYGSKCLFRNRLEATRSLIPRCQTHITEGAGAGIVREKPLEFAKAILDFLKNPRSVK